MIQSILFKSPAYNIKEAIQWLKLRNHSYKKVHITKNYLRFRQISPSKLKENGYSHYFNKVIDNGNIIIVECYK